MRSSPYANYTKPERLVYRIRRVGKVQAHPPSYCQFHVVPMNTSTLLQKETIRSLLDKAKRNLVADGRLRSVLLLQFENASGLEILLDLPQTSESKRRYFAAIGQQVRQSGCAVQAAVMIGEIWFVEGAKAPGGLKVAPSQHPARREAISIIARDDRARWSFVVQPFTRSSNRLVWESVACQQYNQTRDEGFGAAGLLDCLFE